MLLPPPIAPVSYQTLALGTVHGGLHPSEGSEGSSGAHDEASGGEAGSHNTFSSDEDTGGASSYHAHYPYWVYTSHPSQECEERNTDCPPVDQAQLSKYQQQRQSHSRTVALTILGAAAVVLIIWVVARYSRVSSGKP